MNFQRTTGLFSSILWTKLFCVVFLALSCLGTKGVKEEKITWSKIWTVLSQALSFLSQLVATSIAHRQDWCSFALYLHALHWLYLPVNGWRMDEPITQKQPDGRCV